MVNPVLLAGVLANATARAHDSYGYAVATPGNCEINVMSGASFPAAGDSCAAEGAGSVAWSIAAFQSDSEEWSLFCAASTLEWTATANQKSMSEWVRQQKPVVRFNVDTSSNADDPPAWGMGAITGMKQISWRCDEPAESGFKHGGALYVCLSSMKGENPSYSAAICTKGRDTDTPACATQFVQEGGFPASCDAAVSQNPN